VRLAFLMLVVLNLGFFAWARWIDVPANAGPAARAGAGVPTLQLLDASPAPAAKPPVSEAASATAPTVRCRSVGPFDDGLATSGVSDRLRSHGWQPRVRNAQGQVLDGYWVYLSDLKDPVALRSALARLNAAGIHDAAALTAPEQTDRVSVGFFSDQAHAVRRAEQVRALGFKPTLDVHQRTANQHWLDFELRPGEPEPTAAEALGEDAAAAAASAASASALQLVPCPTGGTGG
jgi:hypothetical protein